MLIGTEWKIESDALNITLKKKRITEKGEVCWDNVAYFAEPHNALKHLVNLEIKETELKDFQTVCKRIDELHYLIDTLRTSVQPLPEVVQRATDPSNPQTLVDVPPSSKITVDFNSSEIIKKSRKQRSDKGKKHNRRVK